MRSKKWLGLAVLLAAMVLAINAFAFRTADVTNGLTITVDSTSSAALAISAPTTPDPGISATISSGKMNLTINEKVQPDSVYTFEQVLQITNKTAYSISLSASSTLSNGVTAVLRDAVTHAALTTLAAGASVNTELVVTTPAAFGGTLGNAINGSIVITGTR